MAEAIGFFRSLEIWIYLLLGSIGLIFIRRFILAWQELKGAGFGMERESAQGRLNQSSSILVLLIALAVSEFVLVSFVAPAIPGAIPLLTPTVTIFSTPTITLPPDGSQPAGAVTVTAPAAVSGCVPGEIELAGPKNGTEVSGVVEVNGTASILNFGFYKIPPATNRRRAFFSAVSFAPAVQCKQTARRRISKSSRAP